MVDIDYQKLSTFLICPSCLVACPLGSPTWVWAILSSKELHQRCIFVLRNYSSSWWLRLCLFPGQFLLWEFVAIYSSRAIPSISSTCLVHDKHHTVADDNIVETVCNEEKLLVLGQPFWGLNTCQFFPVTWIRSRCTEIEGRQKTPCHQQWKAWQCPAIYDRATVQVSSHDKNLWF